MKFRVLIVAFVALAINQTAYALRDSLPDFAGLVSQNAPAVVNISTTQAISRNRLKDFDLPDLPEDSPFRDFLRRFLEEAPEERDPAQSLGSGFIISEDGYILTCAHVIADATEIIIRLHDRREVVAKVIGSDRRSDVALLKIDAKGLPTVKVGDPDALKVGEWVLAIGSPFGFDSTATAGIVSAKGRSLPNENYVPFIQTDVAINPGNSGGPLFNLEGRVVGINAQIYSRTGGFMGLSFAVPIDIAMQVAEQLKASGRVVRGWLGVLIQNVTRDLAESFGMRSTTGALVAEVVPDSPAAKAGLKPGDVIRKFDNQSLNKMSDLPPLVGVTPVGKSVPLEIIRDGKTEVINVTIGELPSDDKLQASVSGARDGKESLLGMKVENLTSADKEKLSLSNGVRVVEVGPGSARRSGINKGDVILQIHGHDVKDVDHLKTLLAELPQGKSIPLLIRRDNRSLFLALRRTPDEDTTDKKP